MALSTKQIYDRIELLYKFFEQRADHIRVLYVTPNKIEGWDGADKVWQIDMTEGSLWIRLDRACPIKAIPQEELDKHLDRFSRLGT